MAVVSACPDGSVLEQLALGWMPPAEVERLARHCEQCSHCIAVLHSLNVKDMFIEAMAAQRTATNREHEDAVNVLIERLQNQPSPVPPQGEMTATFAGAKTPSGEAAASEFVESTQASDLVLAPPQAADEIGRLGGYRILKMLGAGGMGRVYLAEDVQLQRSIALKVMKPELAKNPSNRERFLREARAAAKLRSDHIVSIYQVGEQGDAPFLAMEYLEGGSLADWLRKEPEPTLAQAARLARQIAQGLADAHACGLIHRDIKPANIWLDRNHQGRVRLLDFGLARGDREDVHLTQVGAIVGTPAYMAPEQARGDPVDSRADLFSLGVVLYRLTTGQMPFRGENTMALLTSLALDTPTPPRRINPDIPARMATLIERLLAKDREQRPKSAKAVAEELAIIEREAALPVGSASHSRPTPAVRRRLAASLLALAGVAAAVVVIIRDKDGHKIAEIEVPSGGSVQIQDKGATKAPSAGKEKDEEKIADAWFKQVAVLPAAQQVEAVVSKLKERNPGFDGKVTPQFNNGEIIELQLQPYHLKDLSALLALPGLQSLQCQGGDPTTKTLADLSTLKGLKLKKLILAAAAVSDLSPLKGMPLTELEIRNTKVSDLSPLKGMPLMYLKCESREISDLSPLKGMPLTFLSCNGTKVVDLTPLKGMPLMELGCFATNVSDLTPLKDMKLMLLDCSFSKVSDLSPLQGMPLTNLSCNGTQVSDLTPLKGMPLTVFNCSDDTPVSDLSPLRGMPLKELWGGFKLLERNAEILRSIKTLEKINGKPATEFWKEADALKKSP